MISKLSNIPWILKKKLLTSLYWYIHVITSSMVISIYNLLKLPIECFENVKKAMFHITFVGKLVLKNFGTNCLIINSSTKNDIYLSKKINFTEKPHFGINFAQKFKFFSNISCEINSIKDKIPILKLFSSKQI